MPNGGDKAYQLPVRHRSVYQQGVAQTVRMQLWLDGAQVTPHAASTFKLFNAAGAEVAGGAVVLDGDDATFLLTTTHLSAASAPYGKGYKELWSLQPSDKSGHVLNQWRPAAVAPQRIECPVSEGDILRTEKLILARLGTLATNLQDFIDKGWERVLRRLWGLDWWPEQFVDTDQLVEIAEHAILAEVFDQLATAPDDLHYDRAKRHREAYREALESATLRLDMDFDNVADSDARHGLAGVVHRNGAFTRRLPRWA